MEKNQRVVFFYFERNFGPAKKEALSKRGLLGPELSLILRRTCSGTSPNKEPEARDVPLKASLMLWGPEHCLRTKSLNLILLLVKIAIKKVLHRKLADQAKRKALFNIEIFSKTAAALLLLHLVKVLSIKLAPNVLTPGILHWVHKEQKLFGLTFWKVVTFLQQGRF